MHWNVSLSLLALSGLLACTGGSHTATTSPPPDPHSPDNAQRCDNLDLPILGPARCPASTQQLDLQSVCNEPNFSTTVLATCSWDQNVTGTWRPIGSSGTHLAVDFRCQGVSACSSCWSCSKQHVNLTYTDGSSLTIAGTDANDPRVLELDHCIPPVFDVAVADAGGTIVYLFVQLPTGGFVTGSQPIGPFTHDPYAEADLAELMVSAGTDARQHSIGRVTGGQIAFSAASFNPNDVLAFSIDAALEMPPGNTQESLYEVYCGDSNALYHGQWMVLDASKP